MSFRSDLLTKLRADATLAALVGARVHWGRRPRSGQLPAVTLSVVAPGRNYCHAGAVGLADPRVRCECWGASLEDAVGVAIALTGAIETRGTTGTTRFSGSFLEMEADPAAETAGDGTEIVRTIRDFKVAHQPA